MIGVYAIAVVVGLVGILFWVGLGVVATAVDGWKTLDLEERYGARGRAVVAGVTGFGMGGMSASYAGWSSWLALVGAAAGAGVMAFLAKRFGPRSETQ
jgi:hypothetical protein